MLEIDEILSIYFQIFFSSKFKLSSNRKTEREVPEKGSVAILDAGSPFSALDRQLDRHEAFSGSPFSALDRQLDRHEAFSGSPFSALDRQSWIAMDVQQKFRNLELF